MSGLTGREPDACHIGRFTARLHADVASIEALWRRMEREGASTVYQSIDWVACLARSVLPGRAARLAVVEVTEAGSGRPVLLLPLMVRRVWAGVVITGLDRRVCDYAAPLLAAGMALNAAEAAAAWRAVRGVLPRADLIAVGGIPEHVAGVANPLALLPLAQPSAQLSWSMALHGDPETLVRRVCSASFARNIAKTGRRLAAQGEVRCVVAQTREETSELLAVLLEQRQARFGQMGRFDLLGQAGIAAFYREAALLGMPAGPAGAAPAPRGPVRLLGLSVGGVWVATFYGLAHHGAFHGIMVGMNGAARWHGMSPGLFMVVEAMKWAHRQGMSYFDMTVGDLDYKHRMGARGGKLFEMAEPLTLRGTLMLRARLGAAACAAWLRARPNLFARVRTVRRALRRWRAEPPA
jgi:CelD/BcsL family acetyltransferase involved in cellulose biosynthesis